MKTTALIFALIDFVTTHFVQAQQSDLQAMVDAERAFIEMAKTQNRRDAFLFFLSDSAVTQGPDGPIKGKARLQQQSAGSDWLNWEVGYSDMAGSGDFGFNTGPWEFRAKKADEKPTAFGEFNSIWKKQVDGSWKNVLDIGISHGAPSEPVKWYTTSKPLAAANAKYKKIGAALAAENTFQMEVSKDWKAAYRNFVSSEAHLMVAGQLPFVGSSLLDKYLSASPAQRNVRILGTETATSGDLGYVYGTTDVSFTKEGKPETKVATFVRVWKVEGGKWKIVLDVLTF